MLSDQLLGALESRIVIEQAKGVLSERLGLTVEDAFEVLRSAARCEQTRVHSLAEHVVATHQTPAPILRALDRRASRTRIIAAHPGR
ncbi:MAG: ANTAR domain-containing protein [Gaiellales bacterium]